MARLHIIDAEGRRWQYELSRDSVCTIGRAADNCVVLNDPRSSRYHAHIRFKDGAYTIIDGHVIGSQIKRSANKVLIDGRPREEHALRGGERIAIGGSLLRFEAAGEDRVTQVRYSDQRLGHTQLTVPVVRPTRAARPGGDRARDDLEVLRRKARALDLLYELSHTIGSAFDIDLIFDKTTDIIFSSTPAARVVALLCGDVGEGPAGACDAEEEDLRPVAARARDERLAAEAARAPIGRTITRKAMRERAAVLSQDAAADPEFSAVTSVVAQGVRSTICAPLITESNTYGALYADRLDPLEVFTRDDLELITAIALQTAVAVENVFVHRRLAREEVARANYGRFLPEHVVRQVLAQPESFRLGGTSQTVTVLFADIRGFTRLAEGAPPERIVLLLNQYFSAMTDIVFAHGGTLDKFIGDGLMALFGAPTPSATDAANAVLVAAAMQRRVRDLNREFQAAGLPQISVGVGIHTGVATVGYIGSERRMEYTAIGDTVNLAARLESHAGGGQVLLSEEAARSLPPGRFALKAHRVLSVKNRTQPVQVYEVDWEASEDSAPQTDPLS